MGMDENCQKDKITTFDIFHSFAHYIPFDSDYKIMDFYKNKNLNLYYERVMSFDEWNTSYPIMNKDTW